VSPHFTEGEVVGNDRRPDLVTPYDQLTARESAAASRLLWTGLEPLRERLGRIRCLGFVRRLELNTAVDGTDNSQHLTAEACDWLPMDLGQDEAWAIITAGDVPGLSFDHLNYYASLDVPTFHIDNRSVEVGPPRMKLYVDWVRWQPES
jgi:hypothetical protein